MGYEYTIRGWLKSDRPVDLDAVAPQADGGYEFKENDRLETWARVSGRRRNYVTFATQAKHRSNYYLAAVSALMAASGGPEGGGGCGLVTVTGEWSCDGKDRFVLARDGRLLTLPTLRLYDPLSPWNAVYRWTHYMGREVEVLAPPDPRRLREALGGRDSVKGWLDLRDHRHDPRTAEADAGQIIAEVAGRDRRLEGGITFLNQYMEPHLLVGQDGADAASAVLLLAEVTARREGAYGLLYCSGPRERSQVPVAFERGGVRVLPQVSLGAGAEPRLLPTPPAAYEGLGSGFQAVPLRCGPGLHSPGLHGLFRAVARVTSAEPVAPHDGWREETGVSGPCRLFEARGLACVLTTNDGQARNDAHAGWPYLLIAYLEGSADPDLLMRRVAELVSLLSPAGIEAGLDLSWPG